MTADRKLTIKDLAQALGVSHSTVSRALAGSPLIGATTRQRIQDAATLHGYVPNSAARMMRGAASGVIGLLVPDVQTDFFSSLVKHISTECAEAGMSLLLSVSRHDPAVEERMIRAFREARVGGIAVFPTKHLTETSRALLAGVSTVQVGRSHIGLHAPFIASDDAPSMEALARHLLGLGHRRIGYIGSDPAIFPGRPRWAGARRVLGPLPPPLRSIDRPDASGGRRAMEAILAAGPPPTAVIVASAPMMLGVLEALQQAGLGVPHDVSLAGFGDPEWFRLWGVGITTVALPTEQIAAAALAALGAPGGPARLLLANRLVLRGSTAAQVAITSSVSPGSRSRPASDRPHPPGCASG